MTTETAPQILTVSDAYRNARLLVSWLCASALAWGAAQFEFKSLSFGPAGSIDLSSASIPIVLACAIAYTMARCTLEFAMQPETVRRWHLAQADFKLTVFLVRAAALILGAGGLYRSVETVLVVALFVVILLVASALFIGIGVLALTPLRLVIRKRKGLRNHSPVWAVAEAGGWAVLVTLVLLIVLYIALGVGFLHYEPLQALLKVPPAATAVAVFVLTGIAVILSVVLQPKWYQALFAYEAPFTEERLADGRIGIKFRERTESAPLVSYARSNRQRSCGLQQSKKQSKGPGSN